MHGGVTLLLQWQPVTCLHRVSGQCQKCVCADVQTGVLGRGTFGMVIRATDPETDPPTDVAIKLLPRGNFIKNFKTYVKREILHQSSLKHPFIVSLREVR